MNRCSAAAAWTGLAALIISLGRAPCCAAQPLELRGALTAPELGRATFVTLLIDAAERAIADRTAGEAGAEAEETASLRASINCRLAAIELMKAGERAGGRGSVAVMVGCRLARGQEDLDRALARLRGPANADGKPAPRQNAARELIRQFNRRAPGLIEELRRIDGGDAIAVDRIVVGMFAPLVSAVQVIDSAAVVSHWPPQRVEAAPAPVPDPGPAPAGVDATQQTLERLRDAALAARLRADTAEIVHEILGLLERGSAFPEHRPMVGVYGRALNRALAFTAVVHDAAWLDPSRRDALDGRLHDLLVRFKDQSTREAALAELARLDAARAVLERVTALETAGVEVKPIAAALDAADQLSAQPATAASGAQIIDTLGRVVERMVAFRERPAVRFQQEEWRRTYRLLERAYEADEASLLRAMPSLAGNPAALADPAIASLLVDHAHHLDDLRRVGAVAQWNDVMRLMRPASARAFAGQTRKMLGWLLDPTHRPDAIAAMNQLEQQLKMFQSLPMEAALRLSEPAAMALTGGQEQQLVQRIDLLREEWAQAWSEGDAAGPAAQAMLLTWRLCRIMQDIAALESGGEQRPYVLDRWAAWELNADVFEANREQLIARVKAAVATAIDGKNDALRDQLDRLDRDAPLTRLAGRLAGELDPWLRGLPGGAVGVMGKCVHLPPPVGESFFVERRDDLAAVCRYTLELQRARRGDQAGLAQPLADYVRALALDLLAALGERPAAFPRLIGFDGTDPQPGGEGRR